MAGKLNINKHFLRICASILLFVFSSLNCFAQFNKESLHDKVIGVYFSKKNFTLTLDHAYHLNHFVKVKDTLLLPDEDLKLAAIIKLGTQFTFQLKNLLHEDSTYFLNAEPVLASDFLKAYNGETFDQGKIGQNLYQTDYILIIDSIELNAYPVSSVYVVSNKMKVDKRMVRTAELSAKMYDVKSKIMYPSIKALYNEDKISEDNLIFDFDNEISSEGELFADLFSKIYSRLFWSP